MMRMRSWAVSVCLLAVVVLTSQFAAAQGSLSFAQLNGSVLDPGGRVVVGAQVTVRESDTNLTFRATTNSSGFFAVLDLPPGKYDLTVSAPEFAKYQR
ncbi:MAG: carboxypeptidase regulatory-like domain-containing protein, partial [Acidobacteria bacterium]|nr:carboxypeptidase regulatory-like domain-containing protein [Acidobacteriota bacterium]